jgi:hypothetical protein
MSRLTIDRHAQLHGAILRAERLAAFTLASIRGQTAEEVAAEVLARLFAGPKGKQGETSNPSKP